MTELDGIHKKLVVKIVQYHGMKLFAYAKTMIYSGVPGQTEGPPVDRGMLGSTMFMDFDNSGRIVRIASPMKYAPFIHFGTGPKGFRTCDKEYKPDTYTHRMSPGKGPPVEVIAAWVRRKGIAHGDDADRVAFYIARSIAIHGINARPFLSFAVRKVKPEFETACKNFFEAVEFRNRQL
jgi:hypothetical protein